MSKGPRRSIELERRWRERLAEQVASGLSVREFCQSQGLAEPSFYQWRREIARRDRPESDQRSLHRPSMADFVTMHVVTGDDALAHSSNVTIEVGDATIRVRDGVDEETLGRVVRVLRREAMPGAEASPC